MGSGTGGEITFATSQSAGSGTTQNGLTEPVSIDGAGNITMMQTGSGAPGNVQVDGANGSLETITTQAQWGFVQITYNNAAGNAGIAFAKTRNASPTGNTILNSGDRIL